MERPQIYFFLLPLTIITLILYAKMLYVLWKKREGYDTLFYKLIRTQARTYSKLGLCFALAIFDISYVTVFFVHEIPQDWPALYGFLYTLNQTYWVQFLFAHMYTCIVGQILGVTLNSIGRLLSVRFSTWSFSESMDGISTAKVTLIHLTPPLCFGFYIFFGQTPSRYEFITSLNRVARVTELRYVQINSIVCTLSSVTGAIISAVCYILIFLTLRKRPIRSWNMEASVLLTSFVLFLCLCAVAAYFLNNGLLSFINVTAMYALRKHHYAFSFPISLLNPWCLLFTSSKIRQDVIGSKCSRTAVKRLHPVEPTPSPNQGTHDSRTPEVTGSNNKYAVAPINNF